MSGGRENGGGNEETEERKDGDSIGGNMRKGGSHKGKGNGWREGEDEREENKNAQ